MICDFSEHNLNSEKIWRDFTAGRPSRVPVTIYADSRNWLAEKHLNSGNISLRQYLNDWQTMLETQVKAQEWKRLNILSDDGMGYPESWSLIVDCQNYLEIAWLGGNVEFGDEPHCRPFLKDDNKKDFLHKGPADPWQGINEQVRRSYEFFLGRRNDYFYKERTIGPVAMPYNMTGTDGPFTIACGIRGAEAFILDMLDDPGFAADLLRQITESIIVRIRAVRAYLGQPQRASGFGFADDAIVILSAELYERFILPCHRLLFDELAAKDCFRSMHLCGDAQRFFPLIQKELQVMQFDTGFPIDFQRLYQELDPRTIIMGGPPAGLLLNGTPQQIDDCVRAILNSGVMEMSRSFILREANALAPGTPLENVNQIYYSAEKYGYYREGQNE